MRSYLLAIVLLVLPSMAMIPLQNQIHREGQELRYGGEPVTREIRDQIGQGLAIAMLAGFRGVAADFTWIRSQTYFETGKWFKQTEVIESVVKLQPQSIFFWDVGSWHMGWNIAYGERVATNNATLAQGISRERDWHIRARDFLERGIQNIPNRYDLYYKLGWLYQQKLVHDCGTDMDCEKAGYAKAAGYYQKAASFPAAPGYIARDAARCLEKSGDMKGAYVYWRKLWDRPSQRADRLGSLILQREIRRVEDLLDIPNAERIFPKATAKSTVS